MNKVYCVAGITIFFKCDDILPAKCWKKFLISHSSPNADMEITLMPRIRKTFYNIEKYVVPDDAGGIIFRTEADSMMISKDWGKSVIFPLEDMCNLQAFLIMNFHTHALYKKMIQIHGAIVRYSGRGIMFLGPSGIGKTTQAELWNRYRDALIINGDIVFVQETEDCFLGWGTPWHGSSPYCENTSVPIHAMIVLKQSPDNSIRELTGFEKVMTVSNSVFYPQWLENGMELCLETLDHLLTKVPVYELSCRPDEEAVTLTEQFIF